MFSQEHMHKNWTIKLTRPNKCTVNMTQTENICINNNKWFIQTTELTFLILLAHW